MVMKKAFFKSVCKSAVFLALLFSILVVANYVFHPLWLEWNNFYTHKSFYAQPKNTIQLLSLGTSITVRGMMPTQLYEKYGICAYNYATEQQPFLSSYFLLQEVYKHHPDSLKIVVMDCWAIVYEAHEAFYKKSIDPLRFSKNKIMAAREIALKNKNHFDFFSYLFTLLAYHERYKNLTDKDFIKFKEPKKNYRRGYEPSLGMKINSWQPEQPVYLPFRENLNSSEAAFNEWSLKYFKEIANFCEQKNIKFVVYKSPDQNWNQNHHAAMKRLAGEMNIPFLDMNVQDNFLESEFDFAINMADPNHPNFLGAEKITNYVGKFIMENFPIENISSDEKYDFLQDDLEMFKNENVSILQLKSDEQNLIEQKIIDAEKYLLWKQKYDSEMIF